MFETIVSLSRSDKLSLKILKFSLIIFFDLKYGPIVEKIDENIFLLKVFPKIKPNM